METNTPRNARPAGVLPVHTSAVDTHPPSTKGRRPGAHTATRRDMLVEEALAWLAFVRARTGHGPLTRDTLSDEAVTRKAFEAMRFTLSVEANHFAVPSKLVGTKARQAELRALAREKLPYGTLLDVLPRGEALTVWYKRLMLGAVQAKHVRWLLPLFERGATVRLTQVTGTDERGKTLGVNVAFAFVGIAALRAERAIGRVDSSTALAASGDGLAAPEAGDGQEDGSPVLTASTAPLKASTAAADGDGALDRDGVPDGDGVPATPALVAPLVLPLSHPATHPLDVVLWRGPGGQACASVPHACLHSPTGIEWGYRGAGPCDLALSVLCRFTDVAHAERLYHAFAAEVIARVPPEGGRLSAARVAAWVSRRAR